MANMKTIIDASLQGQKGFSITKKINCGKYHQNWKLKLKIEDQFFI